MQVPSLRGRAGPVPLQQLPAGARVLSLLDQHGPLGVGALATVDRCSQPTMSATVAAVW